MTIEIPPNIQRLIDERVRSGEFPSQKAAVDAALQQMFNPLSNWPAGELNAMVEKGLADLAAGHVHSHEEVVATIAETRAAFSRERSAR